MNRLPGLKRLVLCIVVLAQLAACTSMRTINMTDPQRLSSQVSAGDRVRIQKKDLTTVEFRVETISSDTVAGDDHIVSIADIARLEVSEVNALKTAGLIGAIVIVGAAAAVGSGSPIGNIGGPP